MKTAKSPEYLMEALAEIRRDGASNMLDYDRVMLMLRDYDYHEEADWLEQQGIEAYSELMLGDFDRWLAAHPDAALLADESLAARTARETGLELISE